MAGTLYVYNMTRGLGVTSDMSAPPYGNRQTPSRNRNTSAHRETVNLPDHLLSRGETLEFLLLEASTIIRAHSRNSPDRRDTGGRMRSRRGPRVLAV